MTGGMVLPGGATTAHVNHDPDYLTVARKFCRRVYRDFLLNTPARIRWAFTGVVTLMVIGLLLVRNRRTVDDLFGVVGASDHQCKCPVYGDVTYLKTHLSKARTVFKGRLKMLTKDRQQIFVIVEEIFRGPPRIGDYYVILPVDSVKVCSTETMPVELREEGSVSQEFLVAADLVEGTFIDPVSKRIELAVGVARPLECGAITVIPWDLLAWEVVDALTNEGRIRRCPVTGASDADKIHFCLTNLTQGLFLETWWRFSDGDPKNRTMRLVESEWWMQRGTSLVAACRDQNAALERSLRNWLSVENVDEVVLVDWSSEDNVFDLLSSKMPQMFEHRKLQLVTVTAQQKWSETLASNVGIRLATRSNILRVNCDTLLPKDFVVKHPVDKEILYHMPVPKADDQVPVVRDPFLAGLAYGRRVDFLAINGFDERINSHGYADIDLAFRAVSQRQVSGALLNDSHVESSKTSGDTDPRVYHIMKPGDPLAEEVEFTRNRIMVTRMGAPAWGIWNRNVQFNAKVIRNTLNVGEDRQLPVKVYELSAANAPPTFEDAIGEAKVEEGEIRALKSMLQFVAAPVPSSKTNDKNFLVNMLMYETQRERYATILGKLRGGCAAKMLVLAAVRSMLKLRPDNATNVYPRLLFEKDEDCSCKLGALVSRANMELYDNPHVHSGADKVEVFPENATYEVASIPSLRTRELAVGSVVTLQIQCDQLSALDDADVRAIRTELADLMPPEGLKASGDYPRGHIEDLDRDRISEKLLRKDFLRSWQGSQPSKEFLRSYKQLAEPKSGAGSVEYRDRLLAGCDDKLRGEIFTLFPELTAAFATLRSSASRCLGAA